MDTLFQDSFTVFNIVFSNIYPFRYDFVLKWNPQEHRFRNISLTRFGKIIQLSPIFIHLSTILAYGLAFTILKFSPYEATNLLYFPLNWYCIGFLLIIFLFSMVGLIYIDAICDPSNFVTGLNMLIRFTEGLGSNERLQSKPKDQILLSVSVLTVCFGFVGVAIGPMLAFFDFEPLVHICRKWHNLFPYAYNLGLSISFENETLLICLMQLCRIIIISVVALDVLRLAWFLLLFTLMSLRNLSHILLWMENRCCRFPVFLNIKHISLYTHGYLLCYICTYHCKAVGFCMTVVGVGACVVFNFWVITFFRTIPLPLIITCTYASFIFMCDMMIDYHYGSDMNETSLRIIERLKVSSGRSGIRFRFVNKTVKSLRAVTVQFGLGGYPVFGVHKHTNMRILSIVLERTMEAIVIGSSL